MGILDRLFEDRREDEFDYTTVSKSGKPTDDPEKTTKVVALLKQSTSKKATVLGKKFEDILRRQAEIDAELEEIKESGIEFVGGLFDARDAIYTRVVETAKVTLTLSKETVRKNVKFDQEKFLQKMIALVPDLESKINNFAKECTNITETMVKSSFKPELKKEGFSDLIKRVKDYINKIVDDVKKWTNGYDKKLNSIQKEVSVFDTETQQESYTYLDRIL